MEATSTHIQVSKTEANLKFSLKLIKLMRNRHTYAQSRITKKGAGEENVFDLAGAESNVTRHVKTGSNFHHQVMNRQVPSALATALAEAAIINF